MSIVLNSSTNDWIAESIAELPPLVTKQEAAKTLRVSCRTIARLVARGHLRVLQHSTGGSSRVLIPRPSLEAYLRSLEANS